MSFRPIQSIARALDIFEHVARSSAPVPLKDLHRALELLPTTTYNLAETLVHRGYLRKSTDPPGYLPGDVLAGLLADRQEEALLGRLESGVSHWARRLPETTLTLSALRGGSIVVLRRMSPERPGVLQRPRDRRFAPYASVSALVLQACCGQEDRRTLRREHPFEEFGLGLWASIEALEVRLGEIRADGYALMAGPNEPLRLAVPVYSEGGSLYAAMGFSTPPEDAPFDQDERETLIHDILQFTRTVSAPPQQQEPATSC